ncbi:hypothetical protein [Duganella sp. Root1480D1]|uniref:hypothetical protein n=1 Tax=Duganella sp. Root1480D1 TaxID=1736471 RepID=UPI000710215B|nr:hypothetical protein [Duganella sp. Root1480D1]KQZ43201.1 hypothetical protein ASD58_23355 [Duganella sp. Root1480D1]
MDPVSEVRILAEYVSEHPEFTEAEALDALIRAGVGISVASDVYSFTQSAWARALVAPIGMNFSDEYIVANESGEILSRGKVSSQAHFIAATKLVADYYRTNGFLRLAASSSEYGAIEQMERAGKDPSKAKAAPQIRIIGEVTPEAVNRVLAQLNVSKPPDPDEVAKAFSEHSLEDTVDGGVKRRPWWRLW